MLRDGIDIDTVLIDRCRKGDSKAQYELYSAYAKAMYNVCLRIVGDSIEAEDILQESFLEAFAKLGTFRHESTLGAWLKRIVVNRSVNYLKRRKLLLMESLPDAADDDEPSYDNEAMAYDVKRVCESITKLPDGYRLVLSLYLLEGYDHAEIGEILNITESTSKSQYNRARKRLLEMLTTKESGR